MHYKLKSRFRPRLEPLEDRIALSHKTAHEPPGGGGSGGEDEPALFSFESAFRIGGSVSSDFASAVAVDPQDGSYFVAGNFSGTIDLDPANSYADHRDLLTSSGLPSGDGYNVFLAKYSSDGTFLWAEKPGGAYDSFNHSVPAMALDPAGNVYASGYFAGEMTFGATTLVDNSGGIDGFVAKYDVNTRTWDWARAIGGSEGWAEAFGIAADEQSVYVTGAIRDTVDFDLENSHAGDADVQVSVDARDAYVVKYGASAGDFDWVKTRGNPGEDNATGVTISGNSIFVSGYVSVTDPSNNFEAFVWKLRSSDGADDEASGAGWYRQTESDLDDNWSGAIGFDVAADNLGNVWTTGRFSGGTDFDPDDPSTPSAFTTVQGKFGGGYDGFVWKLRAGDGEHFWAGTFGGDAWDQGSALATDSDGNVYVTGKFEDMVDFDPGTGNKETFKLGQKNSERAFVLKLDNSAAFVWAAEMGDVDTLGGEVALSPGSNPNVLAVGGFSSEGSFGDITLTSAGGRDGYVVTLSQAPTNALTAESTANQLNASTKPDKPGGGKGSGGKDSGPSYTIVDLGSLGGGRAVALDVNDNGQVVGWSSVAGDEMVEPFLLNPVLDSATGQLTWFQDADADGINDLMIPLGTFGSLYDNLAFGINEKGQIVGVTETTDFVEHAFLIDPLDTDGDGAADTWYQDSDGDGWNDLMVDLGVGLAFAINENGQVLGALGSSRRLTSSFVIDPRDVDADGALDWFADAGDGTNALMIDLKVVPQSQTTAFDINDTGRIVGTGEIGGFVITPESTDIDGDSAWVRDSDGDGLNDLAVVLPDHNGGVKSAGYAISNTNVIAGSAEPEGGGPSYHATQWQIDASGNPVPTELGLLQKKDDRSTARDVNDSGNVVGYSHALKGVLGASTSAEQLREPFITINGNMEALESLVTDSGDFSDLDVAWAVNSDGFIVGWEADDTTYGDQRAFIAIPNQSTSSLEATSSTAASTSSSLTATNVQPLLTEALQRWQSAGADISGLDDLEVVIADLSGTTLGLASGSTIFLDINAAGWGWFVDPTPWEDSEFTTPGDQGEQNRMDLLTVIAHELGHILGYDHDDDGVMAATLAAGERQIPGFDASADWEQALYALAVEGR